MKNQSMGAMVEFEPCSACDEVRHHPHYKPSEPSSSGATFVYASAVEAPNCKSCGEYLSGVNATDWACLHRACSRFQQPLSGDLWGVYPARSR